MGGGKGGSKKQKVEQKIEPWSGAVPYIQQALQGAQQQYEGYRPQYYPGATVAPFAPAQMAAQNYLQQYAGGVQPYIDQAQRMSTFMQSPAMLDVAQNPYVGGMADVIGNRMGRMLTEQALPAVRSGAQAAGQLGGSRQALNEALTTQRVADSYGDALANLYGGAYRTGLGAVGQAQQMAPMMSSLGAYPAQLMAGVGAEQRAYDQQLIDAARQPWQFYEQQPYDVLDRYFGQATGAGGLGQTSVQRGAGGGPSTLQNVIGGAALGGSALPALGSAFGFGSPFASIGLGPLGMIGGGLLGGLFG